MLYLHVLTTKPTHPRAIPRPYFGEEAMTSHTNTTIVLLITLLFFSACENREERLKKINQDNFKAIQYQTRMEGEQIQAKRKAQKQGNCINQGEVLDFPSYRNLRAEIEMHCNMFYGWICSTKKVEDWIKATMHCNKWKHGVCNGAEMCDFTLYSSYISAD